MKNKIAFLLVLISTFFCITGCSSTKAVPYSFAGNESENGTASITFVGEKYTGVDLFYFEDTELPLPKRTTWKGEYWAPVIFPAGRPLTLKVGVYHSETEKGKETVFNCPTLTAGKNYKLELEVERGFLGKIKSEKLVLSEERVKKPVYEQPL